LKCSSFNEIAKKLANLSALIPETKKEVSFRTLLLNQTQEVFENKFINYERAASSETERVELIYKKTKLIWGNCYFIGALFKVNLIPKKIIQACISQLINEIAQSKYDVNIEELCILVNITGEKLDQPDYKTVMDAHFKQMLEFTNDKEIPTRLRFMLYDVVDLRNRRWVPHSIYTKK